VFQLVFAIVGMTAGVIEMTKETQTDENGNASPPLPVLTSLHRRHK